MEQAVLYQTPNYFKMSFVNHLYICLLSRKSNSAIADRPRCRVGLRGNVRTLFILGSLESP